MRRRSAFLALAGIVAACGGSSEWDDVTIEMPPVLRTDLHNVYYLGLQGQLDKTADHTNLFWHAQWFGLAQLAQELAKYPNHNLVLDCGPQLYDWKASKNASTFLPGAEQRLATLFAEMRSLNILHRVKYIVPGDEPNLNLRSEFELRKAMFALKVECQKWPELSSVRHACIYADWGNGWWALDEFNVVGVDNYGQKSGVLVGNGAHAQLTKELQPHQRTMIIPGAAFGQDPAPFVAYAHANPRVEMVVPFLWSHIPESADREGWIGLERRTPQEQEVYRQAGLTVLNRKI